MRRPFSNRQSLVDAATVLAARQAIDVEIARLVADPFDQEAARRLEDAVGANAQRAQEALERLVHVAELDDPWESEDAVADSGVGSEDEVAPPAPGPRRLERSREEPSV